MKYLFLSFLFLSCAHHSQNQKEEDLVTLNTALMQAQASYLKGCVDAMKSLGVPISFPGCRDQAVLHRKELDVFMSQDINTMGSGL